MPEAQAASMRRNSIKAKASPRIIHYWHLKFEKLAAKKSKEKTRAGALFDLVLRAERAKQDKELAEYGKF